MILIDMILKENNKNRILIKMIHIIKNKVNKIYNKKITVLRWKKVVIKIRNNKSYKLVI